MNVELVKMNEVDFEHFLDTAVVNFAEDKVRNGSWKRETSLEQSQEAFGNLLPDREKTENHYLKNIVVEGETIGYLWYAVHKEQQPNYAYLYEIFVSAEHRGRGFGKQVMTLFMQEVKALGIDDVWLHVFGHNNGALKLYQQLGFEITDYNMRASTSLF
ncbi:GNAT family N-acetyltransferase [Fictibacillus iocasae]|uniref:GNAT family N-acetyltransferase n=1 Tax=Fictibacillus iocasae TaxID=2715437 RepID=A0ABW2NQA7_9BACL